MQETTEYKKIASHEAHKGEFKRCLLLYSGGLDTSTMLKWIQDSYECEVVTLTVDLGQTADNLEEIKEKAIKLGAVETIVYDAKKEFAELCVEAVKSNATYQGGYALGCPLGRVMISKVAAKIAEKYDCQVVAHGATGKGNDQVRFELGYLGLKGDITVIAPWREWDLNSREKLLAYARKHGIDIAKKRQGQESPYSMDANLLHISYEGLILEDPSKEPDEEMWLWTNSPENAPERAEYISIEYKNGDPIAINGEKMSPATILETLNRYGNRHGIGRVDIVENRYVGIKARGCYETPGGTIMLKAHRAIESITLDREEAHLKDELMPKYASLIYNGYWWSPERGMLQALIDKTQENVEGVVRVKLYKGNVMVVGRESNKSLFSEAHSTFEEDNVYDQSDAEGFI